MGDSKHVRSTGRARSMLAAAAGVATLLLLGSCATTPPPEPDSMRDPQANFAAYHTFGWTAPASAPDASDEPLKLLDANLRDSIATEMKRRGYLAAPAGTTPDLRMTYETASADKLANNPVRVGIGIGGWSGNVGGSVNVGSPSVLQYKEGTLVVHAIDTARNAEVWQGRVSGKVTKGSLEPPAVAQAVAIAMKDFPNRN